MGQEASPVSQPHPDPIPFVDFKAQWREEKDALSVAVEAVFAEGMFVGGSRIAALEEALSDQLDGRSVVCVNSGTDALILALRVLGIGPGDEVITPPNSFVASTAAIVQVGATPVFADVLPDQNIDPQAIEAAITDRTTAIMPVHLTGRLAAMPAITAIAERHGLAVIEDAAQAFGSSLHDRPAGTWGNLGCFSAHPLKNLGAAGDAGFIATRDTVLADRLRRLRNHGLIDRDTVSEFSTVSRLDALQAAVLQVRLTALPTVTERRRANAERYRAALNHNRIFAPPCAAGEYNTFHTFVVQLDDRDELMQALAAQDIETAVHYPIPIHRQPAAEALGWPEGSLPVCEAQAGRILSLPVHQYLNAEAIDRVCAAVNGFYR